VLRLLSRPNTTKGRDLEAYQTLIMSDVKHDTSVIMSDLVAALRPLFNESLEPTIANNTTKVNTELPIDEESCPNYDSIAQQNIDFSQVRLWSI
jgi:hypothetical protein